MKKTIIASAIVGVLALSGVAKANDLNADVHQANGLNYVHADAFSYGDIVTEDLSAIASAVGNSFDVRFEGDVISENTSSVSILQENGGYDESKGVPFDTLQYSTAHVLFSSGDNVTSAAFAKGNSVSVLAIDDATHEFEDYQITQVNGVSLPAKEGMANMHKVSAQNAYSAIYDSSSATDMTSAATAVGNGVDMVLNNQIGDQGSSEADTINQLNQFSAQYAESWVAGSGTITAGDEQADPVILDSVAQVTVGGDLVSVARAVGNDIKLIAVPDSEGDDNAQDSHELEDMTQVDLNSYQSANSFVGGYSDTTSVKINYYSVDIADIHYNSGNHDDTGNVVVAGDSSSVALATGNSLNLVGDQIRQAPEGGITWSQTANGQGVGDYYHNQPLVDDTTTLDVDESVVEDNGGLHWNVDRIAEYVTEDHFGVGESALAVTQFTTVGGDAVTYADATANEMNFAGAVVRESNDGTQVYAVGGKVIVHDLDQTNTGNNVELGVALSLDNGVTGDLTTVAKASGNTINFAADIVEFGTDASDQVTQSNISNLQLSYALSDTNIVGGDLTTSAQSIGNAINIQANRVTGEPSTLQLNGSNQYAVSYSATNQVTGSLVTSASAIGNSISFASLPNVTGAP